MKKVFSKQILLFINTSNNIDKLGTETIFLTQKMTGDLSNNKSAQKFANKDNADEFNNLAINELFNLFFINIETNPQIQKYKKQTFKTNARKC